MSSTTAFCLRLAKRRRLISRLVIALGRFAVDEQAKTVLKPEAAIGRRLFALFGEGAGHAREVEGVELVDGRCAEHGTSLLVHS